LRSSCSKTLTFVRAPRRDPRKGFSSWPILCLCGP
jgi:hypothetical protein